MDVKPTLVVFNEAQLKAQPGVTRGQTLKPLVGNATHPTDRVRVALATYEPGTVEALHWHPIDLEELIKRGGASFKSHY